MKTVGIENSPLVGALRALNAILDLRKTVGDGLTDPEFTHLVLHEIDYGSSDFSFLCFSNGCATFTVPDQDFQQWQREACWIAPAKEQAAQKIADKFHLHLCEPPDEAFGILAPKGVRHHIEFVNQSETVAVVHPVYLKQRLFATGNARIFRAAHDSLPDPLEFFGDLAGLYLSIVGRQ